ncbi:phage antirepressor KilAC domain-containing protein [Pseudomonas sp.]|uniref:phage antirepressor KilAC domain-containing protein n=1 Tax=Pseudomonas sp. TaxID=306 RepID=UPI002899CA2A|nr:phage antirepressor KilAC domain-containing protein [Pseudomonas sp.]
MSSLDLLDIVNQERINAGENEIRRNDFNARCKDELEGDYYESFVVKNSRGPASEAILMTIDQCMYVLMRESKLVRRRVLSRIKELESRRVAVSLPDFSNPAAAARAWAEQYELQQAANQQLAIAAPKAAFVDRYVEGTGLKGFRQVCKLLNAKQGDFRMFLVTSRVMYRLGGEWVPYAEHIDAGRFSVKTGQADNGHNFNEAKFTPKGIEWIAGKWAAHLNGESM